MKKEYNRYLSTVFTGVAAGMICGCCILGGCDRSDQESLATGSGADNPSGEPVVFSIVLADNPVYNTPGGETRSSRPDRPLISEWVKVSSFDATRPMEENNEYPGGEPEKYSLALMELYEDSVSTANTPKTRSILQNGFYFRVIAFKKTGSGPDDYAFQCTADYTSGDGSTPVPVLGGGNMILPIGQTYRFVAYSFNNGNGMGAIPGNYQWKSTAISISPSYSDFLTYVSGDIRATGTNLSLTVSFRHMLCEMNVRISGISFTGCQGVYIRGGGNATTWTVGSPEVARNYADSYLSNIADNFQGQYWRLVPSTEARHMQVHINSVSLSGIRVNDIDVTSSQSISLQAGMRYTMKLQFKKIGINVPISDINLTANGCTQEDKEGLARLKWADGNLKSTSNGSIKDYVWTTPTDYGYYYTFYSTYTGNTTQNNTDPCDKLNPDIYGTGWRTPTRNELEKLSRCTDKQFVSNAGVVGMWFMNSTKGLFLPAAGSRTNREGSGIEPTRDTAGTVGYYWSSVGYGTTPLGYGLDFESGTAYVAYNVIQFAGIPVRCVKGAPQ